MLPLNRNPKKWNAKDRPGVIQSHAKRYHEREPVHQKARMFRELTEDNRAKFLALAKLIRNEVPDAIITVFGSRVNGNFLPSSDYDMTVKISPDDPAVKKIKEIKFPVKVDLKFDPVFINEIKIP